MYVYDLLRGAKQESYQNIWYKLPIGRKKKICKNSYTYFFSVLRVIVRAKTTKCQNRLQNLFVEVKTGMCYERIFVISLIEVKKKYDQDVYLFNLC